MVCHSLVRAMCRCIDRYDAQHHRAVANASRHLPQAASAAAPTFNHVAKALRPSEAELDRNPRARSATLRAAIRTSAPFRTRRAA